jgi:tRNA threonylcarbamoyladenosine biosynthesis protein TsaB
MLLAVDTSTQWMGLALFDGTQIIAEQVWQTRNHHTVELAPAVDTLLKRSAIKPADLQALAVALGPGSFTSLRIGLALVKGMALVLRLPLVGIPTLDILSAAQPLADLPMAAVLQAGRKRLAVGWYDKHGQEWKAREDAQVMTVDELAERITTPTWVCGELNAVDRQILARKRKEVVLASASQSLRRPSYLAEMAWKRWQRGKLNDVISLSPIYLHVADPIPD